MSHPESTGHALAIEDGQSEVEYDRSHMFVHGNGDGFVLSVMSSTSIQQRSPLPLLHN